MKRSLWMTTGALMLAAVTAIPLMAQPPQGRGPGGRGMGWGGAGGPGPMPILRGLDLSDAQREQIRAIAGAQRAKGAGPQSKVMALQKQLGLAILADTPDPAKLEELKGAISAARAEELAAQTEVESRIAQVLTSEQRAQARETLAKMEPPGGDRRGRGARP